MIDPTLLFLLLQLLQTLEGVNSWTLKLDKLAETLAGHTQQTKDVVSYLVENPITSSKYKKPL